MSRQGGNTLELLAEDSQPAIINTMYRLPPLILHPFSGPEDASVLMESARASMALQGWVPTCEESQEVLDRQLLKGRYAELRMLYYIGKDLTRWMEQCVESVEASGDFQSARLRPETFGIILVQQIPDAVRQKLESWGVLDFSALFRRSIGFHSIFREFPTQESLSPDFLRKYHRHLDQWFEYRMRESAYDRPQPSQFSFDLFASGEYTMLLEQSWND